MQRGPRRPDPASWLDAPDPVLAHVMAELDWYERSRDRSRRLYRVVEIGLVVTTSATVVAGALSAPAVATSLLAAASLLLTGLRQVFGSGERWTSTAVAWMELRQAVVRYRLLPEAERDGAAREALLARMEEIALAEVRAWAEFRRGEGAAEVSAR
ncbi:DUF4231 domain-containing protein [Streptacidiphilus griseoplanus]|uniref:DUF4231 domain-containing protein n=1 Tax=Peterkaempfera griseoplana TaxID=66896 RepID=UPI0006E3E8A1|nr:DUF4231 domain-containing protein [Peterkaempfera griseoplana]